MDDQHQSVNRKDQQNIFRESDGDDSFELAELQDIANSNQPRTPQRKASKQSFATLSFDNDSLLSDGHATQEGSIVNKRNQRLQRYLRIFLLLTVILVGILLCGVVYYFARSGETDLFENHFSELAQQVINTVTHRLQAKLLTLEGLSIALSSETRGNDNLEWPTTMLSGFEERAVNLLAVSDSLSVIFSPLVENEELGSWNDFLEAQAPTQVETEETIAIANTKIASTSFTNSSMPVWQHYPELMNLYNHDLLANPSASLLASLSSRHIVIGNAVHTSSIALNDTLRTYYSTLYAKNELEVSRGLMSNIYYPILDNTGESSPSLIGLLTLDLFWENLFLELDPLSSDDAIVLVLRNQCGQVFTFNVQNGRVTKEVEVDQHNSLYDHLLSTIEFEALASDLGDFCEYTLEVYPSRVMEDSFATFKPALYTASVAFCLTIIFIVSLAYERRVAQVNKSAVQYRAVVSNLFPPAVRQRMLERQEQSRQMTPMKNTSNTTAPSTEATSKLNESLREVPNQPVDRAPRVSNAGNFEVEDLTLMSKPIADNFKNATVLFADIAGFTSWSSKRSPEQVFRLLQTLFNAFDSIAKKRKIFKVETIGDCYMAVTGVPEPQEDHALRMTKFARECLQRVKPILRYLEESLGPGTTDLAMRVGLHSGPVTAGVLQGEKSRFQLFGDTVNTASRMESNGAPGCIHMSKSTADLLVAAEKGHWLEKREDPIHAKGKGLMETYWIKKRSRRDHDPNLPKSKSQETDNSDSENLSDSEIFNASLTSITSRLTDSSRLSDNSRLSELSGKIEISMPREKKLLSALMPHTTPNSEKDLISWHVTTLTMYLKNIVHQRRQQGGIVKSPGLHRARSIVRGSCPYDELSESIHVPKRGRSFVAPQGRPSEVTLSPNVVNQINDFVTTISQSYRGIPFHNFIRATHTAMFLHNFLQEINKRRSSASDGDCLEAIAGDPLIQFSLMFAALIHDADHSGAPNEVLAKEQPDFAKVYKGRLIAEQHSLELSWELLMDECFHELQQSICSTKAELVRFRQLLVNLVLATDFNDKELSGIRSLRWEEAFTPVLEIVPGREKKRLKVALVIELLLQVADVSHTMQAWNVYTRWSKKQYFETHEAYLAGRVQIDPSKTWYAREAYTFDRRAIPLVEKLVAVTGWDALLEKVKANRQKWLITGKTEVKEFAAEASIMQQDSSNSLQLFENNNFRNSNSYRFSMQGDENKDYVATAQYPKRALQY
eukprot:Nitzschia sp. Nitz4//scaffold52_size167869//46818//50525//NITZ4_002268-RA/size167869-processed-gene-0.157-mRNA-1//-1//CDS//3329554011//2888//frame0